MSHKHIFAFYSSELSNIILDKFVGDVVHFKDSILFNRLVRVVKIREDDSFVLFNNTVHVFVRASGEMFAEKRIIIGVIDSIHGNKILLPEITLGVGLLRKEAWDQVVYVAAQMGATRIVPILSERVQRSWGENKERARMDKVMIAAREQSKNFSPPKVFDPMPLETFLNEAKMLGNPIKVCFEHGGRHLWDSLYTIQNVKSRKIFLLFGPEGGFSRKELDISMQSGFEMCGLTPTVLRSIEAVTVGLGAIRSCCS